MKLVASSDGAVYSVVLLVIVVSGEITRISISGTCIRLHLSCSNRHCGLTLLSLRDVEWFQSVETAD